MTREQKLEQALREVRSHFDVEMDDDGRTAAIGYDSKALQKVVRILDAALSTPKVGAVKPVEPVAYLVHNFMVARQPVKAQGRFPSPDHYLYPASRKDDAEATAKTLRADCDPLYTSPVPAPTITDEAVERAADEIVDIAIIDFNGSITNRHEVARAALLSAFPSRGGE